MYKPGGTIADAMQAIERKEYVLPAIQREFVWKTSQIERLFDSFMQGYPFGTFLFWRVSPETSGRFKFYDFVLNYHQRDAAHCPDLGPIRNREVSAVLDGQQRLTALNIGLRGSMAIKLPNRWWTSPDAFPVRKLRLNLLAPIEADENGVCYDFRFLTDDQVAKDEENHWFTVPSVLGMEGGPSMLSALMESGLQGDELMRAYKILDRLHTVIHKDNLITYYEERAQDLERVLNIFIRLNSGGTVLSYSDLLLSIAVAQWKQIDARAEIHRCVDDLNKTGTGFGLSQDFVLKAGLMLSDVASVGFKVENFTAENMAKLEANWPRIRTALIRTVELVAGFGLNGQTLRADSALLPIAYYIYVSDLPANYLTHSSFAEDRARIQKWLVQSLLKSSGIWGSGLDTLLTALRESLRPSEEHGFPDAALRRVMTQRGKSLTFEPEEIEELLNLPYGDKRTFSLLSLLFPFVDLRNQFHIDHVYPISRFSRAKLAKLGLSEEEAEALVRQANSLPNLQLLEGPMNIEKRAKLPAEWLAEHKPSKEGQAIYRDQHLLGELATDLTEFPIFFQARYQALKPKIEEVFQAR